MIELHDFPPLFTVVSHIEIVKVLRFSVIIKFHLVLGYEVFLSCRPDPHLLFQNFSLGIEFFALKQYVVHRLILITASALRILTQVVPVQVSLRHPVHNHYRFYFWGELYFGPYSVLKCGKVLPGCCSFLPCCPHSLPFLLSCFSYFLMYSTFCYSGKLILCFSASCCFFC